PQLQPLAAKMVEAHVLQPDGQVATVPLNAEKDQLGNFVGDFRVAQQGPYVVSLAIPDSQEELIERVRVELPVLEQQPLVRNESFLKQLASAGGGNYYSDGNAVLSGSANSPALATVLPDRS